MSRDFDLSGTSRSKIIDLLKQYTMFGSDNPNNGRSIDNFIRNFFYRLEHFNDASITFDISLNPTSTKQRKMSLLFQGIANAICKNNIQDYHHRATGYLGKYDWYSKHVITWRYLHYHFTVFTKITPGGTYFSDIRDFYMRIIDTNKLQDSDIESDNDTEPDHEPDLSGVESDSGSESDHAPDSGSQKTRTLRMLSILQSLHNKINILEAKYGPSTASPPRLE